MTNWERVLCMFIGLVLLVMVALASAFWCDDEDDEN